MTSELRRSSAEGAVRIVAAAARPGGRWRRLSDVGWLPALGALPIGDKELLNLAHHLPVAVSADAGQVHVVALIHPSCLRRPVVDQAGRWTPPYRPLAVRALPFHPVDPATGAWRSMIVEDPGAAGPGAGEPFYLADGRPAPAFEQAMRMLVQLVGGARRLAAAAEALIAADLLAPLVLDGANAGVLAGRRLLVADPAKVMRLTPARTHALARDGFLALDLLTASHFSQRLLSQALPRPGHGEPPAALSGLSFDPGELPIEIGVSGLGLDSSPLFSIEAFLAAAKPARDP